MNDWEEIRSRLARASRALDEALDVSPERGRALMEARSRVLSNPSVLTEDVSRVPYAVLTFALAGEIYAIEAALVREVSKLETLARVPGAPAWIAGVTHVRGEILAVLDLRRLFGVLERGITDLARIVTIGRGRAEIAILADEVIDVADLGSLGVFIVKTGGSSSLSEWTRGLVGSVAVLDGDKILDDPKLFPASPEEGARHE